MRKTIIHEFDPVIFPRKVWIVISSDAAVIRERLEPHDADMDMEEHMNDAAAFTFSATNSETGKYGVCIVFPKRADMSAKNIAHEAFHAAEIVLYEIGQDKKPFGDEVMAYLIGWIVECIAGLKK